jgi:hypothetical protein
VRDGRMVPDIEADEISFLIETQRFDERDACDRLRVRLREINPEIEN